MIDRVAENEYRASVELLAQRCGYRIERIVVLADVVLRLMNMGCFRRACRRRSLSWIWS